MGTHFERSFEKDLDRIRERITHMAGLGERALKNCVKALREKNRQLAYGVILGDRGIDEMERELDRLCLEFLVRQQPVAGPLRFAYSTIRINLELERIGDYAESIARQILKLIGTNVEFPTGRFIEIADLSIPMLHDSVQAFVKLDAELARRTMNIEETVDVLRTTINTELYHLRQEDKIPLAALTPLMTIARRFERVSDQAKNICQEVIYCATGENPRHKGEETYRLLFLDQHDSCRAPMAAAVGNALKRPSFVFESAGLEPQAVDGRTVEFLAQKGIDIGNRKPKRLDQVPDFDQYHVVIGLAKEVQKSLPPPPRKTVYLDWTLANPSEVEGSAEEIRRAYEKTYEEIRSHIRDLLEAIVGEV
ncbi:MAG: phosphate signaling complex protein PhoU [Limisphaerales bacterium]